MNDYLALQDRFLEQFFTTAVGPHFYLTGGTALSRFYFDHRESLDLDLFTQNQEQDFSFINRTILQIAQSMQLQITNQVVTETFLQYIFTNPEKLSLKIDIVKDIPVHFGEIIHHGKVRVDSLENIGSNKILAIFGRTEAKDFIDFYWLLQHTPLTFTYLYELAKTKDLGLTNLYFAYSLQRVNKLTTLPRLYKPLDWSNVVTFYQTLAQTLLLQIKPEE
jgi:predicted nucleotidyltransferase component of viral defense system